MKRIKGESEQETAIRNLNYIICKSLGIVWLVKKLPFLTLKPHYKLRDENPELLTEGIDDASK